jgi:hypothetical protein
VDHYLVESIEKALGWNGPQHLGQGFARGSMADPALCTRLLTPTRLLDVIMRRALSSPQFRCFRGGDELHPDAYLSNTVTRRGQSLSMAVLGARLATLAAITHNLLRAAGTLTDHTHAVARGATLRRHLVNVPARIAKPQGKRTLHLPVHWPRAKPWKTLWDNIFTDHSRQVAA